MMHGRLLTDNDNGFIHIHVHLLRTLTNRRGRFRIHNRKRLPWGSYMDFDPGPEPGLYTTIQGV